MSVDALRLAADRRLVDSGVVAIIRTSTSDLVMPVCEALLAGGLKTFEITLTVPDAVNLIRTASQRFGGDALIGAGTVVTVDQARAVMDAGARFLVSPITRASLVTAAHEGGCPIMLGAYTPTEAQTAHEAGADFVKLFPADQLGPGYVRNLRAPLPHLRIVPTGGVDLKTAPDFLRAGCIALGVGSSLLKQPLLQASDWSGLAQLAASFVAVVRETRATLPAR